MSIKIGRSFPPARTPASFVAITALAASVFSAPSEARAATLGSPTHVTTAVHELASVKHQWSDGAGTQFGPTTGAEYVVDFPDGSSHHVHLDHAFSVAGTPFVELAEAHPCIGPWAAVDEDHSTGFLSYAVNDINAAGADLEAAGMQLIAISEPSFAFYQGVDGVVFELVDQSLVPAGGGVAVPQAPIDLGIPGHLDTYVSEVTAIKAQWESAFNLYWVPPEYLPGLPFTFSDGSVVPVFANLVPAVGSTSVLEIEQIAPNVFPFISSPGIPTVRPAYEVQGGSMSAVMAQLEGAGFTREAVLYVFPGFPVPGLTVGEPVIAVHAGRNGVTIETIDVRLGG